jgi:hypothetical protein
MRMAGYAILSKFCLGLFIFFCNCRVVFFLIHQGSGLFPEFYGNWSVFFEVDVLDVLFIGGSAPVYSRRLSPVARKELKEQRKIGNLGQSSLAVP